ncbi:MAG: hypothetical protein V4561_11520 [Bacteroidota bacterium]
MQRSLLLPNRYKKLGWILFCPTLVLAIYTLATHLELKWLDAQVFSLLPQFSLGSTTNNKWFFQVNLTNTLVGVIFIISCLLIGFSKEQNEDEYISKLRLQSLLWAVLLNYCLLLAAFILIYDIGFLNVMLYNMFTVLLLFIFRFHYLLYRSKAALNNEK